MQIKVDIDVSPEEMRRLMGLPDLEGFQRQILDDIRERMTRGVEGYDPMLFFQPYMRGSMAGMEFMQKLFSASLGSSGDAQTDREP